MNGTKPAALPAHISEEPIGIAWCSHCAECEITQSWNQANYDPDTIIAKKLQFRRIHKRCDQKTEVTPENYEIDTECEICGRTSDLGVWLSPIDHPIVFMTVCDWCQADTESFKEYFMEQMEISLEASADYEKSEDGKWRNVSK